MPTDDWSLGEIVRSLQRIEESQEKLTSKVDWLGYLDVADPGHGFTMVNTRRELVTAARARATCPGGRTSAGAVQRGEQGVTRWPRRGVSREERRCRIRYGRQVQAPQNHYL